MLRHSPSLGLCQTNNLQDGVGASVFGLMHTRGCRGVWVRVRVAVLVACDVSNYAEHLSSHANVILSGSILCFPGILTDSLFVSRIRSGYNASPVVALLPNSSESVGEEVQ